ncbi:MAG: PDZ domain-containing protein [Gammaproteobacteria bacterium]|nr:PDZ domain-containing protein [Gammaproteobacteria bacterium]
MRIRKLHLALIAVALVAASCSAEFSIGDNLDDTSDGSGKAVNSLEGVRSAVVRIIAHGSFVEPGEGTMFNTAGTGSGFIIDKSGIAVTNNHVVAGAAFLDVYVNGEAEPRNAKVLGVSECSDLAVIDIDGDGFDYLVWSEDPIVAGEKIYAAGFPLGSTEYTLLDGIVSKAKADGESDWSSVDHVIEHSADTLPGSSGGPIVTEGGNVIAVNYAGDSAGQAYAIGRDEALSVLDQLKAGEDVTSIGINGQAISQGGMSGVFVNSIVSGSPAGNAGVKPGDIVTLIEGIVPATDGTMADYCDVLRSRNATDAISIEVYRPDTDLFYEGVLNSGEKLAAEDVPATNPPTAAPPATASPSQEDVYEYLELWPGTCFDDEGIDLDAGYITPVDCNQPHDNEVIAIIQFDSSEPWPGSDVLQEEADTECAGSVFEDYVGVTYNSSALYVESIPAPRGDWEMGMAYAICVAYDMDWDPITGSVYQSGY